MIACLVLAFSGPPVESSRGIDAPEASVSAGVEGSGYEQAKRALEMASEMASDMANRDPAAAIEALEAALTELHEYAPLLAADQDALAARSQAQLNLARAMLIVDDEAGAEQAMDEAIRGELGGELEPKNLGPRLVDLYLPRRVALDNQGLAKLIVDCFDCDVYINERRVEDGTLELLLGEYRVWIEDPEGRREPHRERVSLTDKDDVETLYFGTPWRSGVGFVRLSEARSVSRLVPRWGELSLIAGGVTLALVGGVILAHDRPSCGVSMCTRTVKPALPFFVVGGAAALLGGVFLIVDEVRVGERRGQRAMLGWSMRF
ncbi:hypothetical protein G6O69_17435 [Pseudenhygromyxa sp. WMMC2535]|uniref:hypothetical protein n=1 Tax=Pseudenhygromyxa sp. WMMC2535 TaxID=2712867 RepID=UPI001595073E|nr:hypothetical protein [Pseudenhygromyxa sp. WMMC2535]NVB39629.1 hypothetical protein [Pseudenhygromyxa sp. WMMC2535]